MAQCARYPKSTANVSRTTHAVSAKKMKSASPSERITRFRAIAPMRRRLSSFSRPRIVPRRAASATAMSHQRFSLNLSPTAGPISEVMIVGAFGSPNRGWGNLCCETAHPDPTGGSEARRSLTFHIKVVNEGSKHAPGDFRRAASTTNVSLTKSPSTIASPAVTAERSVNATRRRDTPSPRRRSRSRRCTKTSTAAVPDALFAGCRHALVS